MQAGVRACLWLRSLGKELHHLFPWLSEGFLRTVMGSSPLSTEHWQCEALWEAAPINPPQPHPISTGRSLHPEEGGRPWGPARTLRRAFDDPREVQELDVGSFVLGRRRRQ